MEGIGRGTTLGGRYVVDAPLGTNAGAGRWSAFDNDLGRDVTVLVLAHDAHRGPAVLDAARMAAGIAQMTLVRILDIGSDDHFVFVVEESLQRAPNLTDLVRDGGLPGDEVRRITGEVATGLETASQRGVHHLELTPDDVFRTVDGDVKVQGLGTSAALHSRAAWPPSRHSPARSRLRHALVPPSPRPPSSPRGSRGIWIGSAI